MNFKEFLRNNIVYLDGGMGTLLQENGLKAGEYPERWNISHPEVITKIHKGYFDAGSNVVCTNTFGANSWICCVFSIYGFVYIAQRKMPKNFRLLENLKYVIIFVSKIRGRKNGKRKENF